MSDDEFDYDDDDNDEGSLPAKLRKQLTEANKRAAEAEKRAEANEAAARRVAFQDANVPDTPQTKFFREHYNGPVDAESIRAAALEYGFATADDPAAAASTQQIQQMSDAMAGGENLPAVGDMAQMEREMDEAAMNAQPGFEARAIEAVANRYRQSPVG